MENFIDTWDKVIEILKPEMPSISLDTWIKPLELVEKTDTKLIFKAQQDYQKTIVETRYLSLLKTALSYVTKRDYDISIILSEKAEKTDEDVISNI